MVKCECGFIAKTAAGLASHRRRAHPDVGGENRRAAEKFLTELRRQGRIDAIDVVRVQLVRGLADALDQDSQNAQMWKVYRETIEGLLKQDDDANDGLNSLIEAFKRATPVVHPETP